MPTLDHARSEPPSASFYQEVTTKPWTKEFIKYGLRVDDAVYAKLYNAIEGRMQARNILGLFFNTRRNKKLLEPVLSEAISQFQELFRGVPEQWRDKCIGEVARKCASNERRRVAEKAVERSLARPPIRPPVRPRAKTSWNSPVRPFGTRVVVVLREGRKHLLCRTYDLQKGSRSAEGVPVDDMSFEKFVDFLARDLSYEEAYEKVYYPCIGYGDMPIANELCFKAALEDMHTGDYDQITFVIKGQEPGTQNGQSCTLAMEDGTVEDSDDLTSSDGQRAGSTPPPSNSAAAQTSTETMRGAKRKLEANLCSSPKRTKA